MSTPTIWKGNLKGSLYLSRDIKVDEKQIYLELRQKSSSSSSRQSGIDNWRGDRCCRSSCVYTGAATQDQSSLDHHIHQVILHRALVLGNKKEKEKTELSLFFILGQWPDTMKSSGLQLISSFLPHVRIPRHCRYSVQPVHEPQQEILRFVFFFPPFFLVAHTEDEDSSETTSPSISMGQIKEEAPTNNQLGCPLWKWPPNAHTK